MAQVLEFMINPQDVRRTSHWGKTTQFFPLEKHALAICTRVILGRGCRRIQILTEAQAAINAMAS